MTHNALALNGVNGVVPSKPERSWGQAASLFLSEPVGQVSSTSDVSPSLKHPHMESPFLGDHPQLHSPHASRLLHDDSFSPYAGDQDMPSSPSTSITSTLTTPCTSPALRYISTSDSNSSLADIDLKKNRSLSPLRLALGSPSSSQPLAICPMLIFPPQHIDAPAEWDDLVAEEDMDVHTEGDLVAGRNAPPDPTECYITPATVETTSSASPSHCGQDLDIPLVAAEALEASAPVESVAQLADSESREIPCPEEPSHFHAWMRPRPQRMCTRNSRRHFTTSVEPAVLRSFSSGPIASSSRLLLPAVDDDGAVSGETRTIGRKAKREQLDPDHGEEENIEEHLSDGEYTPHDDNPRPAKRRKTTGCGGRRRRRRIKKTSVTPKSRCKRCNTTFTRAHDLKRHNQSTTCSGAQRLTCPYCEESEDGGNKLSRYDALVRHIKTKHKGFEVPSKSKYEE
ncbi:hypothetical protein OBBRIDRAFT_324457 [Obba rivulosa]|uniref:Uncharacterized protein n=1 Tax=Obba rivulosa TaxID=1052685 RepID=A0A8E2DJZ7_9APHY|nr:hypothetical protein OBBRIDRAFT_324457 [Obba rivulosa]